MKWPCVSARAIFACAPFACTPSCTTSRWRTRGRFLSAVGAPAVRSKTYELANAMVERAASSTTRAVTTPSRLPPFIGPNDGVVLFDGLCRLCGAWARFLIRFDTRRVFRLATVQSDEGQAILAWFGLPTDSSESMVLVEGSTAYTRSSAFIRVMRRLPFPWPLAAAGWIIPAFLRNWMYDRIARDRYRIFGRHDVCVVPTPDHQRRFLGGPAH
jgi:predicted DCC family thiol-disulfide oxidoreductase YuxK